MKKANFQNKGLRIFTTSVFIYSLFAGSLLLATTEYDLIKQAEESEKKRSPEIIVRPQVEYKADELADPFSEPFISSRASGAADKAQTAEALPNFIVQGLIWGGNFPQAIINNKVVKVGDTIEGARIISIDKNGVSLFFNERQYRLTTQSKTESSPKP